MRVKFDRGVHQIWIRPILVSGAEDVVGRPYSNVDNFPSIIFSVSLV